jgi:hypothetical protein
MMALLDETKIIDRDGETTAFKEILGLGTARRVLVISERAGNGHTDTLRKIRLQCERDFGVPVALLSLENFKRRPDEFAMVTQLSRSFRDSGANMKSFENLNRARALGNTTAFFDQLKQVFGAVDLTGATVSGGTIAALLIQHADVVNLPEWSPETEREARALCVEAFLSDLNKFAAEKEIVLLIDGLEKMADDLRRWVLGELVRRQALMQWQSRKLVVVIAGADSYDLVLGRLPQDQHECVEPIRRFDSWSLEQVGEFLRANGFMDFTVGETNAIHSLIQDGSTLKKAILVAETIRTLRDIA